MKGGAHPSPFAALSFPNSKKVPIYCSVDRESFPVAAWPRRASNSRDTATFCAIRRLCSKYGMEIVVGFFFCFFFFWRGGGSGEGGGGGGLPGNKCIFLAFFMKVNFLAF